MKVKPKHYISRITAYGEYLACGLKTSAATTMRSTLLKRKTACKNCRRTKVWRKNL